MELGGTRMLQSAYFLRRIEASSEQIIIHAPKVTLHGGARLMLCRGLVVATNHSHICKMSIDTNSK